MFLRLLALFTLVPIVELYLLLELGQRMGWLSTLALVLLTGALGAALARSQGLQVLRKVQAETARGALPTEALLDGLMIFVAGAVLLTPGLLTDFAGFFLLVPAGRRWVRQLVSRRLGKRFRSVRRGPVRPPGASPPGGAPPWPENLRSSGPQQVIVVDHRPVDATGDDDKQLSD